MTPVLIPRIVSVTSEPPIIASDTPFTLRVTVTEVETYPCAPCSGTIQAGMEVYVCR